MTSTTTRSTLYRDSEPRYFDFDVDGKLSDDERDEDADGLTNYDEATGRMTPGYWAGCYTKEKPYPIAYAGTDLVDPDSDGDGVRDGADDQDHDDIPNVMELSRNAASGRAMPAASCNDEGRGRRPGPAQGRRQPVQPLPPVHGLADLRAAPLAANPYFPFDPRRRFYQVLN